MTSGSGAAASGSTVGQRARERAKDGAAGAVVVCCSMTSGSHSRQGIGGGSLGRVRQGQARASPPQHSSKAAVQPGRYLPSACYGMALAPMERERNKPRGNKPRAYERPRGGPARPVAELVPQIGRAAFRRFGFVQSSVVTRWPEIVGERHARV